MSGIALSKSVQPDLQDNSAPALLTIADNDNDNNSKNDNSKNENKNDNDDIERGKHEFRSGIPISKSKQMPMFDNDKQNPLKTTSLLETNTAKTDSTEFKVDLAKLPSYDEIISIDKILSKDKETIDKLRLCLIARGWCKVEYPERMMNIVKKTFDQLNDYLIKQDYNSKIKFSRLKEDGSGKINPQSEYGYNCMKGFKEGLRILTGDIYAIHSKIDKYPSDIVKIISQCNNMLDGTSRLIIKAIAKDVYNINDVKELHTKYDISLFNHVDNNVFTTHKDGRTT